MDGQDNGNCCAPGSRGVLPHFQNLPDPRGPNVLHRVTDMIVIAICAVFCGADGWVQVQEFGTAKQKFFASFLELANGIPSHDTFGRLFARLNPQAFEDSFLAWTKTLAKSSKGKLISFDGKSLRGSFQHAWDKSGMAHLVSAFVGANHLVLGQVAVPSGASNDEERHGNEITTIPRLLEALDVRGATVSIDAIGCQKSIARQIVEGGGDYYLAVKENQPTLHAKVKAMLDEGILEGFAGMKHDFFQEVDGGHGRIETRRVWVTAEVKWLGELRKQWAKLGSVVAVEAVREVGGKLSTERRYYISSRKKATAQQAAEAIRGHWGIENQVHWILDMSFDEDACRIRRGYGAQNFSRLRRIALNRLRRDTSKKVGIKTKRLIAGWNHDYLLSLLIG